MTLAPRSAAPPPPPPPAPARPAKQGNIDLRPTRLDRPVDAVTKNSKRRSLVARILEAVASPRRGPSTGPVLGTNSSTPLGGSRRTLEEYAARILRADAPSGPLERRAKASSQRLDHARAQASRLDEQQRAMRASAARAASHRSDSRVLTSREVEELDRKEAELRRRARTLEVAEEERLRAAVRHHASAPSRHAMLARQQLLASSAANYREVSVNGDNRKSRGGVSAAGRASNYDAIDALRRLEARCNEATLAARLVRDDAPPHRRSAVHRGHSDARDAYEDAAHDYEEDFIADDFYNAHQHSHSPSRGRSNSSSSRVSGSSPPRIASTRHAGELVYNDSRVEDRRRMQQALDRRSVYRDDARRSDGAYANGVHVSPPRRSHPAPHASASRAAEPSRSPPRHHRPKAAQPSPYDAQETPKEFVYVTGEDDHDDDQNETAHTEWFTLAETELSDHRLRQAERERLPNGHHDAGTPKVKEPSMYDFDAPLSSSPFRLSPNLNGVLDESGKTVHLQPSSAAYSPPPSTTRPPSSEAREEFGRVRELLLSAGANLEEAKRLGGDEARVTIPLKDELFTASSPKATSEVSSRPSFDPAGLSPPRPVEAPQVYWSVLPTAFRRAESGEDWVAPATRDPRPSLIRRLVNGERVPVVDAREMRERTRRAYEQLPEVVEARRAVALRAEQEQARRRAREYHQNSTRPRAATR